MQNSEKNAQDQTIYKILHGRQTTDDYPYGRLRCTRHTDLEFKKGKGYRIAHQTINPKTGRLNNPKRSTYSQYIQLYECPETGHTKSLYFGINGCESLERFLNFLTLHEEQLEFTEEQSAELWIAIINTIRTGAHWISFKKEADGETATAIQYLEAMQTKELMRLYGAKANIKLIIELNLTPTDTRAIYEDKQNGESIASFKIAGS